MHTDHNYCAAKEFLWLKHFCLPLPTHFLHSKKLTNKKQNFPWNQKEFTDGPSLNPFCFSEKIFCFLYCWDWAIYFICIGLVPIDTQFEIPQSHVELPARTVSLTVLVSPPHSTQAVELPLQLSPDLVPTLLDGCKTDHVIYFFNEFSSV